MIFLTFIIAYLVICLFKGNVLFGFRILFFLPVYLLEKQGTYLNSLLFNSMIICFCSIPLAHFVYTLFSTFFFGTSYQIIFGVVLNNMSFFTWFFQNNIFLYIFLAWVLLTGVFLIYKRSWKRPNLEEMFNQRKQLEKK